MTKLPPGLLRLAKTQCHTLDRPQCLAAGLTSKMLAGLVSSGRWQRPQRGVYVTHAGPIPNETRVHAAVLALGAQAAACHDTAIWLAAGVGKPGPVIHVAVPERQVVRIPPKGVRVHRLCRLEVLATHPPRVSLDRALLDVVQSTRSEERVIGLVCDVIASRKTQPWTLLLELAERPRQAWRPVLLQLLTEVKEGATSPLEVLDLRNDRAHGLPSGQRQVSRRDGGAGRWLDVMIVVPGTDEHVVKELDGRLGHEGTARFKDMKRDNGTSLRGGRPLRLGWLDLRITPCEAAAFQALLYRRLGWSGCPRRCSTACKVLEDMARLNLEHPWQARS